MSKGRYYLTTVGTMEREAGSVCHREKGGFKPTSIKMEIYRGNNIWDLHTTESGFQRLQGKRY